MNKTQKCCAQLCVGNRYNSEDARVGIEPWTPLTTPMRLAHRLPSTLPAVLPAIGENRSPNYTLCDEDNLRTYDSEEQA